MVPVIFTVLLKMQMMLSFIITVHDVAHFQGIAHPKDYLFLGPLAISLAHK